MATTVTIGGQGTLFVGEDKIFKLELTVAEFDADGNVVAPSSTSVPKDMTGWAIVFDVRKTDNSADPAIFSKTATLEGVFSAVSRAANTQRAVVTLTDTEMNTVKAGNLTTGNYRYSWKRMDDGSETVLARGPFTPEKATAP